MKNKFNPPKFKCAECGEVIQSQHPGHYTSCSCGAISVDYVSSTLGRRIGKLDSFIKIEEENQ